MRQRWYRIRQERLQRRMARLLLDLGERQPEDWRDGRPPYPRPIRSPSGVYS